MTMKHTSGLGFGTGGWVWEIVLLFLSLSTMSTAQGKAAAAVVEARTVVQQHRHLSSTTSAQVPALFVFGDSALDAGTNRQLRSSQDAKVKPYGMTYFGKPTGRVSNGRIYADFLATSVGLPFPEPYLKRKGIRKVMMGVNYASSGSGLTDQGEGVIPFSDQILQFGQTELQIAEALKSKAAAANLFSKSLFLVNIGGNDLSTYLSNSSTPQKQFLDGLLKILDDSVKVLYQAGARKFIVLQLGPVGCSPSVLVQLGISDGKCSERVNNLAQAYNAALEDYVYSLPTTFPGVKAVVGKTFNEILRLVTNGESDGFDAGVNACCGFGMYNGEVLCGFPADPITNPKTNLCNDVDRHVYWDFAHLTERVNERLSELFWSGNSSYVAPFNVETLVNS